MTKANPKVAVGPASQYACSMLILYDKIDFQDMALKHFFGCADIWLFYQADLQHQGTTIIRLHARVIKMSILAISDAILHRHSSTVYDLLHPMLFFILALLH